MAPPSTHPARVRVRRSSGPSAASAAGTTATPSSSWTSGCSRPRTRAREASSEAAWSVDEPGARRPTSSKIKVCRSSKADTPAPESTVSYIDVGTHSSGESRRARPRKSSGSTPITVNGRRLRTISRPTIPGAERKRRAQRSWPRTTTGWPPRPRPSSSVKVRPSAALTPITSKKPPDTSSPKTTSGRSPPRLIEIERWAARPERVRALSRKSWKRGWEVGSRSGDPAVVV